MSMQFNFEKANVQDDFLREIEARYQPATPKPQHGFTPDFIEPSDYVTQFLHSNPQHKQEQTGERTALNHWGSAKNGRTASVLPVINASPAIPELRGSWQYPA